MVARVACRINASEDSQEVVCGRAAIAQISLARFQRLVSCFSSNHPEKHLTHLPPMSCRFTASGEPHHTSKLALLAAAPRPRLSECRGC